MAEVGFDRFTPNARGIIQTAGDIALYQGNPNIGTEHLLFALVENRIVGKPLHDAGLRTAYVYTDLYVHLLYEPAKTTSSTSDRRLTPGFKRGIEAAVDIVNGRRESHEKTPLYSADLLEGAAAEGLATGILEIHNLTVDILRERGILARMTELEKASMQETDPNSLPFVIKRLEVELANPDVSEEIRQESIKNLQQFSKLIRATRPHGRL